MCLFVVWRDLAGVSLRIELAHISVVEDLARVVLPGLLQGLDVLLLRMPELLYTLEQKRDGSFKVGYDIRRPVGIQQRFHALPDR